MTKKALLALLFVPFVIAIFAFVTSVYVIRDVEQDIRDISWSYRQNTAFRLDERSVRLEAKQVYDDRYPLGENNDLVWSVENPADQEVASVSQKSDGWYLNLEAAGKCKVTCANRKGNVSKSFTAVVVGDEGAVIVNPVHAFSQQHIDQTDYVGLYDLSYESLGQDCYRKVASSLDFTLEIYSDFGLTVSDLVVENSPNVSVDLSAGRIDILDVGPAYVRIANPYAESDAGNSLTEFTVVDGVNVYDYDDLMAATNYSSVGECVVMRVSLDSFDNTYVENADGSLTQKNPSTELFGRLDSNGKFLFSEDVYRFETTYNHDFLKQWNQYIENNPDSGDKVSYDVLAGVRIRQDFYGNGFTLNAHELAYPDFETSTGSQGSISAFLSKDNLFRGPKIFVSLGYPKTDTSLENMSAPLPPFALYGQDNIGFLVEGDGITVNDVRFKNCDFGNNYNNLSYAGTVLEIIGDDVTIKNSVVENGRVAIRAFSCRNLLIDNCLLQNAMDYLVKLGSNNGNHVDLNKKVQYTDSNGERVETTVKDYIDPMLSDLEGRLNDGKADSILSFGAIYGTQANEFLGIPAGQYTKEQLMQGKDDVREALINDSGIVDSDGNLNYDGTAVIKDTYFYNSGLSAICLDSLPSGSYLQNATSSLFTLLMAQYMPVMPNNMALTGYPVHLTLSGDCRFYDWKKPDVLDYSQMLFQDLESFILQHVWYSEGTVTDSDYLPLRDMILERNSEIYEDSEGQHLNLPIFFMGGGFNLSTVDLDIDNKDAFGEKFYLDVYDYALDKKAEHTDDFNNDFPAKYEAVKIAMGRAACDVMGFNDYSYIPLDPEKHVWLNETPNISDLAARAGESEGAEPAQPSPTADRYEPSFVDAGSVACDWSKLRLFRNISKTRFIGGYAI